MPGRNRQELPNPSVESPDPTTWAMLTSFGVDFLCQLGGIHLEPPHSGHVDSLESRVSYLLLL
jgi:hypothetical protein